MNFTKSTKGFRVSSNDGSFTRWETDSEWNKMPQDINQVYLVQLYQSYNVAYGYCQHVAKQNGWVFEEVEKQSLLQKIHSWITKNT